ncbi:hypothetical protein N7466_003434 [Penicillium verhagenii]|uniref:uncharacterized protein n=1 Tax=Penicillium verhagenii TaxID=1562060 RepID=UPI0025454592|nr:uncharacterized protein N7466_003434 [Penicillium verhagenii]KAJ5936984.1 hypothetical protein N7466_003434 [Penicillium verhagenii]
MARLNDYTAPPESIEALKRRFVRQNKEIARVNSMQSLRIRSLESEVAHLLAENVSLRQQVINVTQETERLEAAKMLHAGVYDIKARLDTKLAELNDLASELGMLPRKAGKLDKSDTDRPKAAGLRPQPMDPDYPGVEDGRLPAILEDKCYPKRTLEVQEIQNLVQADSSPAQPISDFDLTQQPTMVDSPSPSPPEVHEIPPETQLNDVSIPDQFLPSTLETRKKKKKVDLVTPMKEDSVPREQKAPGVSIIRPAKSGSKRKFSPDEDGALLSGDGLPECDEFQFSRPSQSPRRSTDFLQVIRETSPTKTPVSIKRGSATGTMKRKVLEPKSSNVSLSSPKKARASLNPDNKLSLPIAGNENIASPQKPKILENPRGRSLSQAARRPRQTPDSQRDRRSESLMQSGQPTPVLLKDSPIVQSDIMASTADAAATSRTSRRRGAVVSYAEPNLRDKMRRPTKEMIDAVARDGSRRSSSFLLGPESLGEAGDIPRGEKLATSPCPQPTRVSVNLDSAQELIEMSSRDEASQKLLETMSRRRQSRRHSSNPKSTSTRDTSPTRDVSGTEESHSPPSASSSFMQTDGSLENDDLTWNSSAMDIGHRRETRVAARRKSMMV